MRHRLICLGVFLFACSSGERDESSTIFGSGGFTMSADGSEMSTESSASGGQDTSTSTSTSTDSGAEATTDDTATTDPTTTDSSATDTMATATTDPTTTDDTADPACGNGQIDPGEDCDGGNLGGQSCVDQGFTGGVLACDPTICVFDTSGCTMMPSNQCDNNCNGCACPSDECTMCCALQNKVDVCGGGMCGCF